MRILFLCGSLEPGCDGVGDYTRRLAGELNRQGHDVVAIALFDKFLTSILEGVYYEEIFSLQILRIPSCLPYTKRLELLYQKVNIWNPDWISLQFVPFSFHRMGLPVLLISALKNLSEKYHFHIMFHELWVGIYGKETFKKRFLGYGQKIIIKKLIKKTKPDCITTSIPVYKQQLLEREVKILPLFGNIPVFPLSKCKKKETSVLKVVHFGSFTRFLEDFYSQLQFIKYAANSYKKQVEFVVFGEGGPYKSRAIEIAKNILGEDSIMDRGRISIKDISFLLQTADVGISRADYVMARKSGTTVAMLEHGIPVLLRGSKKHDEDSLIGYENLKANFIYSDNGSAEIPTKGEPKSFLPQISSLFLNYITNSKITDKSFNRVQNEILLPS